MIIVVVHKGQNIVLDYNPWRQQDRASNASLQTSSNSNSGRYENIGLDVTCGDIAKMAMRQYMKQEIDRFYKRIEQETQENDHHSGNYDDIMDRGLQLRQIQRQFQGCRVIGLFSHTTNTLHYHDELFPFQPDYVIDPSASFRKFGLMLSGPINELLTDELLKKVICNYLLHPSNSKVSLPSLNSLMRISKRFRRVCASNDVWMHVNYPSTVWNLGIGSEGTEEIIWDELQFEHGLSRKEIFKLRHLSYKVSRLKLFYGTLRHQNATDEDAYDFPNATIMNEVNWNGMQKDSTMHQMQVGYDRNQDNVFRKFINFTTQKVVPRLLKSLLPGDTRDHRRPRSVALSNPSQYVHGANMMMPQKVILIIGLEQQNLAQRFLQQLHFITPSSATNFHFHPICIPLLPGGKLLDIEASPVGCRSRSNERDAGTRLESSADYKFQYRRVGDLRLTFLQLNAVPKIKLAQKSTRSPELRKGGIFNFSPQQEREIQTRKIWNIFKNQTVGYVLVVEYQSGYYEKILQEVEDFLRITFTPTTSCPPQNSEDHDSQDDENHIQLDEGFELGNNVATLPALLVMVGYGDPNDARAFLIISQFLSQLYHVIERFFKVHQDPRAWFLQPFYSFSEEGNLKHGIFAGLNWLIRKLMKQNESRL